MAKPKVILNCVAEQYSNQDERTIEFTFEDGKGGLINFRKLADGTPIVDVYRIDEGIKILVPKEANWLCAPDAKS